jgi:hypothetical protein
LVDYFFGNKNKNTLQFGIILSTETIVFESFIQFFGMIDNCFSKLLQVFFFGMIIA